MRGAAHEKSDLPNQDAIAWSPANGVGPPVLLAVADGHGSPRCFRSDAGAKLAVEIALDCCEELLLDRVPPALSEVSLIAKETLPREVARRWRAAVADQITVRPFTATELHKIEREKARQVVLDPAVAYGCTLLTAAITETYMLFLQIGDGDILLVSANGDVERPIPKDPALIGNETTSLCMPRPWDEFKVSLRGIGDSPPSLIQLSTDGLSNCFPTSDDDFLKVASDMIEIIRKDGPEYLEDNLDGWLGQYSRRGSGDDITIGLVCQAMKSEQPGSRELAKASPSRPTSMPMGKRKKWFLFGSSVSDRSRTSGASSARDRILKP